MKLYCSYAKTGQMEPCTQLEWALKKADGETLRADGPGLHLRWFSNLETGEWTTERLIAGKGKRWCELTYCPFCGRHLEDERLIVKPETLEMESACCKAVMKVHLMDSRLAYVATCQACQKLYLMDRFRRDSFHGSRPEGEPPGEFEEVPF